MHERDAHSLPPGLPCACAAVRRAARAVTQLYDRALRPSGLRTTQFTLLQALARSGTVPQGRLGWVLALDSTTLTRTLAGLRALGWIASEPGTDRRERLWSLTGAGERQLRKALPAWRSVQGRLRRALGDGEWNDLLEALRLSAHAARRL